MRMYRAASLLMYHILFGLAFCKALLFPDPAGLEALVRSFLTFTLAQARQYMHNRSQ
jgi:hypothetical protein